jgi:hypothetical protein
VEGDPVNRNDPKGLQAQAPGPIYYCDPAFENGCVLRVYMPFVPGGGPIDPPGVPPAPPLDGPRGEIAKGIWNTITGVGMPEGKSLIRRVVENIVGSTKKFDGHMEQIQNMRNRLLDFKRDWAKNDCSGKPPNGLDEWLDETTEKKIRAWHDAYHDAVQEMAGLWLGYAAYKAIRLLPSLLFPPSLIPNLILP